MVVSKMGSQVGVVVQRLLVTLPLFQTLGTSLLATLLLSVPELKEW